MKESVGRNDGEEKNQSGENGPVTQTFVCFVVN